MLDKARGRSSIMINMNRLTSEKRAVVIAALCEGNSIRSTARMTSIAKNTVVKLLMEVGAICSRYMDGAFRDLKCQRIQVDEIWSWAYAKDKDVPRERQGELGAGSVWTWTAIDADTKLIPYWLVATREAASAREFIQDLASRLSSRIQLTSDAHKAYISAVDEAFGADIDFAMLVKLYGGDRSEEVRYPAICLGFKTHVLTGDPDPKHLSTSYAERQNLTMRMSMRRFTRLTNAFSRKLENHVAALALYFMYYNFVRIHKTLRTTPAMAAGVTGTLWSIGDIVALVERAENARAEKRRPPVTAG
jgi:IS1 family transposase